MENIKLFETIKRLTSKQDLQINERIINERAIEKAKENGINTEGQFNFELRQLIKSAQIYGDTNTPSPLYYTNPDVSNIMERVFYIGDCKNNFSVPYISADAAQWRPEGVPSSDPNNEVESRRLTPHRLCTQITLSKTLLNCASEEVEQKIKDALINAIYEKLISSIFSENVLPNGLFLGVQPTTISTKDELIDFQYQQDKLTSNNVWIISAGAKKAINKMDFNPLITDNKLLNSEAICTSLCKDGFIAYLPLNYLCIAEWNVTSISVNPITKAADGKVDIYVDAYFDFAMANDTLIKVGQFVDA